MSRKRATLTVAITFEGTYYDLSEIVSVSEDWIHAGLEDRDDVRGVTITGVAEALPDDEEQPSSPTAALLASRCDACRHTLNWHRNDVGCTVPLCVCGCFQPADEGSARP